MIAMKWWTLALLDKHDLNPIDVIFDDHDDDVDVDRNNDAEVKNTLSLAMEDNNLPCFDRKF